jgi:amino acid transporter
MDKLLRTSPMKNKSLIGPLAISLISISAVMNLREFPLMASSGFTSVFFYLLAALCFLLPSALVCAELATALPENGGIYTWVRTALGDKLGFLAMWMEWINNIISFPATLGVIVATIAYIGFPNLSHNKYDLFAAMMLIYWGCTIINLYGVKLSSRFTITGALLGTLLPTSAIIILGLIWVFKGNPIHTHFSVATFLPGWHMGSLVFFLGVLSSFSGMQIIGFYAKNVKDPARNFPKAIFISAFIIFISSVVASLAIAMVIPKHHLNLMSGVIEGISAVFLQYHLQHFTPLLALLIALGSIAGLSAWLLALARGLQDVAKHHQLPKVLAKSNRHDAPVATLLVQGVLGTLLASVFLFMPSLKSAFWLLIALTSQFTVLMYSLVFTSAIVLRFTRPEMPRPFRIPGGNYIIVPLCSLAIITCLIGFVLGWFPPKQIGYFSYDQYLCYILLGDGIILGLPLWRLFKGKPSAPVVNQPHGAAS